MVVLLSISFPSEGQELYSQIISIEGEFLPKLRAFESYFYFKNPNSGLLPTLKGLRKLVGVLREIQLEKD